ncbi:glutaredoxin family protein [Microbacterium sp.]|uniref:glutaredoxin family protein n=1 Tax=Microbacterium sp. TaxID=51671 RepID=UPI0039E54A4B
MTTLTIISKPDCHLCDVAREVVETVLAEFPEDAVEVAELSIQDDAALYAQWWEKIPVVLIDDRLHAHWRLSPDRLRAAVSASLSASIAPEEEIV